MPLDTGGVTDLQIDPGDGRDIGLPQSYAPSVHSGADIGQALRNLREFQGLSVEEVADRTRVRRAYLAAIEDMRLEQLPSRPFAIGYIRAYALALGADPEAAVERFKSDEPVLDEPLRGPLGLEEGRDPRLTAAFVGAAVIIAAIVLWNVAQRAVIASAPPPPTAPAAAVAEALQAVRTGPVTLGAPLPPPVESTTPDLYETPGLDKAGEDGMGNVDPPLPVGRVSEDEPPIDLAALPATFTPEGRVYYSGAGLPSRVTLQALKPAALIIRGADGSVYFARQLAAGDAYRVPEAPGLTVDVSDPYAFQVFAAGQSKGVLPAAQVAASRLGG